MMRTVVTARGIRQVPERNAARPEMRSPLTTGRRPRLDREELRSLLIDAGRAILREEGLGAGGGTLTFKRARERVEIDAGIHVTNASIIGRLWENQFEYQTEVLETFASDDSMSEIAATVRGVEPALLAMDPRSEVSRERTMREVCRLSAAANMSALSRSTDWQLWIGIWAITAVGAAPERQRRIELALEKAYRAVTEHMEAVYRAGMDFVGYRVRTGVTVRQFTIAVAALAEGCVLRNRVDAGHMNGIMRPTGPGGEQQEWTLFGLALEALAHEFFELDPDWAPAAQGASVSTVLDA